MTRYLLFFIVFGFVCFSSASFAVTFTCERTSSDSSGYTSYEVFESWWPKSLTLDSNKFERSTPSSTSLIFKDLIMENSKTRNINRKLVLLKSGLLIGTLSAQGSVTSTRYKCNLNSTELIAKSSKPQLSNSTLNSSSKTVCDAINLKACDAQEVCSRATKKVAGERERTWETGSLFMPYVNEAKFRGLSCNVASTPNAIEMRLKKLNRLLEKGLITPEEAAETRIFILSDL